MSTFQEVNDASLIKFIGNAQQRVVFVAPGEHQTVAEALGQRQAEIDRLQVTVVIDPNEGGCRIGHCDVKGIELLSRYADRQSFALMAQPGLRFGVLLVDDITLVWSPTPRFVESVPDGNAEVKIVFKDVTYEQTKNPGFRAKFDKVLPAAKRKQMDDWNHDFDAANAIDRQSAVSTEEK